MPNTAAFGRLAQGSLSSRKYVRPAVICHQHLLGIWHGEGDRGPTCNPHPGKKQVCLGEARKRLQKTARIFWLPKMSSEARKALFTAARAQSLCLQTEWTMGTNPERPPEWEAWLLALRCYIQI